MGELDVDGLRPGRDPRKGLRHRDQSPFATTRAWDVPHYAHRSTTKGPLMSQCQKCFKALNDCQACKGKGGGSGLFGRLNCSKCRNTGLVCNSHGGFWKK